MSDRGANRRITFLLVVFGVLFGVVLARAAWIQVLNGSSYKAMASRQHRETIEIPAGRGTIFDRTGAPLAIGEQATTVYADPRNVTDPKRAAIAAGKALTSTRTSSTRSCAISPRVFSTCSARQIRCGPRSSRS